MLKLQQKTRVTTKGFQPGDTLIESVFAFAAFAFVLISAFNIMNRGISISQTSLEINLVTNEINAQAEALRYLHEAYLVRRSRGDSKITTGDTALENETIKAAEQWNAIAGLAVNFPGGGLTGLTSGDACNSDARKRSQNFVLNTRNPAYPRVVFYGDTGVGDGIYHEAATYSRLVYATTSSGAITEDSNLIEGSSNVFLRRIEGIWVEAYKYSNSASGFPGYYDFYIRSCWSSVTSSVPNTLQTVVRLYEP